MCVNFTAVGVNYAGQEYSREVGATGPERPKAGRAKCPRLACNKFKNGILPECIVRFFLARMAQMRGDIIGTVVVGFGIDCVQCHFSLT